MKIMRILWGITACALVIVIAYSGQQLWEIHQIGVQEAQMHSRLMEFRPEPGKQTPASGGSRPEPASEPAFESASGASAADGENQSILDLQTKHSDAVGWLSIPNTKIDYPFAQGRDNDTYLHLDLDQNWAAAGTIFMDYRNSQDFTDFNTILFGHHMNNGSMFGTLQHFSNQAFFEENSSGTVFLADKTYGIDFIAFAVIVPSDTVIYDPTITTETEKIAFLEHVKHIARYYRDLEVTASDRLVTLSTCNYEFEDARMVLIGKLTEN